MTEAYQKLGSFILFRELLADELGHLYRAGEIEGEGVARTVFLRVFDGAGVVAGDVTAQHAVAKQISRILESANVASNTVHFVHEGVPAMAWDHAPAQPLNLVFEKVRLEGFPVPVDNALLILEKLSLALSAALAVDVGGASLLHGFLHPALAVITNDGEAVVSGFGIADQLLCLLDDPQAAAAIAPYVAPEVLAARTASKQGDVYSLGAILYQLLTGVPLPADPGARAAALAQAELGYDEGPIPADIRAVLDRCLAHRPEDRFSSAADFKKELDKLLYGGAYSPTTFNLALFMDRLFRPEIEAEERERLEESNVDVSAFLTPEPEEFVEEAPPAPSKAPWILAAAAIVVAAAVAGYFLLGGMRGGGVPPTPTPEEILAQRQAQQRQVETLVQEQVARMMEQREQELRTEFAESQAQIDDLTQQLRAKERELNQGGQGAAAAQREKERLERDLAAAEEQKRKKEAALEEERQRLLEEARRRMTEQQQARATAAAEEQDADAAAATPSPALASTQRTPAAEAARTPAPTTATPVPTRPGQQTAAVLVENSFVDFTEVDTRPEELKRHQVVWPRLAIHSRRKGVVILSATVNASGRVEEVSVLRADDKGFGIPQAAMDAVRRYVYKPATKDGVKVKTTVTVTLAYNFRQR